MKRARRRTCAFEKRRTKSARKEREREREIEAVFLFLRQERYEIAMAKLQPVREACSRHAASPGPRLSHSKALAREWSELSRSARLESARRRATRRVTGAQARARRRHRPDGLPRAAAARARRAPRALRARAKRTGPGQSARARLGLRPAHHAAAHSATAPILSRRGRPSSERAQTRSQSAAPSLSAGFAIMPTSTKAEPSHPEGPPPVYTRDTRAGPGASGFRHRPPDAEY